MLVLRKKFYPIKKNIAAVCLSMKKILLKYCRYIEISILFVFCRIQVNAKSKYVSCIKVYCSNADILYVFDLHQEVMLN